MQRLLEVTWDVHGATLLLIVPYAGNCQEGEAGEITDPHKIFSNEPWPGTLGLAGKSPLAEHSSVQLEAICGWKWWCQGASSAPSPLALGLPLGEKMYNASVLKND